MPQVALVNYDYANNYENIGPVFHITAQRYQSCKQRSTLNFTRHTGSQKSFPFPVARNCRSARILSFLSIGPQKNGFTAISSATVVNGPCPGQIKVSDGSERICSRTFCLASSHD